MSCIFEKKYTIKDVQKHEMSYIKQKSFHKENVTVAEYQQPYSAQHPLLQRSEANCRLRTFLDCTAEPGVYWTDIHFHDRLKQIVFGDEGFATESDPPGYENSYYYFNENAKLYIMAAIDPDTGEYYGDNRVIVHAKSDHIFDMVKAAIRRVEAAGGTSKNIFRLEEYEKGMPQTSGKK